MNQLKRTRATTLLEQAANCRVLVIGDLMLDEFLWGRARRIAPEAPVPVVEIERESLRIGGAGNVAANLAALGAQPLIVGVIGADSAGQRLSQEFTKIGISTDALVTDETRPTTIKTRIIAHSQHVVRADRECKTPVNELVERQLIDKFLALLPLVQAVVVSDYDKGVITPSLLKTILPAALAQGVIVCIDPKLKNFAHYTPATIVTPNQKEAEEAARVPIEDLVSLELAGRTLRQITQAQNILITKGEGGMSIFTADGEITHIPTVAKEVYDVTGAGDTVVATLALGLALGASPIEAAILANFAAGVVVGKVGTATTTATEVLEALDHFHLAEK